MEHTDIIKTRFLTTILALFLLPDLPRHSQYVMVIHRSTAPELGHLLPAHCYGQGRQDSAGYQVEESWLTCLHQGEGYEGDDQTYTICCKK